MRATLENLWILPLGALGWMVRSWVVFREENFLPLTPGQQAVGLVGLALAAAAPALYLGFSLLRRSILRWALPRAWHMPLSLKYTLPGAAQRFVLRGAVLLCLLLGTLALAVHLVWLSGRTSPRGELLVLGQGAPSGLTALRLNTRRLRETLPPGARRVILAAVPRESDGQDLLDAYFLSYELAGVRVLQVPLASCFGPPPTGAGPYDAFLYQCDREGAYRWVSQSAFDEIQGQYLLERKEE